MFAVLRPVKSIIPTVENLPDDVILSVKNISKKFCKHLRRSMLYGIADLTRNLIGSKLDTQTLRQNEFWAVDNISFSVRKGEILGVIGANGSGKTTLLRLLAGIFPPDIGEIAVRGRMGALIAVGAGFHPHMTGRENIYLNGTILGMTRGKIDKKFQDIVDFAEIAEFLDAPVSAYSSGMRVRLGFAIAAQMEMDVLLIDEVLAVGDEAFRVKCYEKITQLIEKGSTIIFVSHDTRAIKTYCTRVLYLKEGKLNQIGDPSKIVETYWHDIRSGQRKFIKSINDFNWKPPVGDKGSLAFGTQEGRISEASFISTGTNQALFYSGEDIRVKTDVEFSNTLRNPSLCLIIQNQKLIEIGGNYIFLPRKGSDSDLIKTTINFGFKAMLSEGEFVITLRLEDRQSDELFFPIEKQVGALKFRIINNSNKNLVGMVDFQMQWQID